MALNLIPNLNTTIKRGKQNWSLLQTGSGLKCWAVGVNSLCKRLLVVSSALNMYNKQVVHYLSLFAQICFS